MSKNKTLSAAKSAKNGEFCTQRIEVPAYNQEYDNEYAGSDCGNPGMQHLTVNKYDD